LLSSDTVNLLNEDEAEGLARLFESLPQSSGFLHGDFHMNNVMHVSDEGADRLVLIDMAGAGSGHPLLDWACTYQACRLIPDYFDPTACKRFLRLSADYARAMLHPMMESYFGTSDEEFLSRQYALMEALGYAKYACMVVREPNPWMDRQLVAAQLREHVISRLDSLLER
jgi:aminoglycoside/choline kinase family phosphotransferase